MAGHQWSGVSFPCPSSTLGLWNRGKLPGSLGKDTRQSYVKVHGPRRELSHFGKRPCEKRLEAA